MLQTARWSPTPPGCFVKFFQWNHHGNGFILCLKILFELTKTFRSTYERQGPVTGTKSTKSTQIWYLGPKPGLVVKIIGIWWILMDFDGFWSILIDSCFQNTRCRQETPGNGLETIIMHRNNIFWPESPNLDPNHENPTKKVRLENGSPYYFGALL